MAAGFATALTGALGNTAGAALTRPPNLSTVNDRSVISVQPTGINLGEILKPINQGSVPNGGQPINISRFLQQKPSNAKDEIVPASFPSQSDPAKRVEFGGAVLLALTIGAGIFVVRRWVL